MLKKQRCIILLALVNAWAICGCGGGVSPDPPPAKTFPVVVFSDIHFDPLYDGTLYPQLVSSDPAQWERIYKTSLIKTPSTWNTDTNYPLLILALDSIKRNMGNSPMIIYTGDLLGHTIAQSYFSLCKCQDQDALNAFSTKTVAFVTAEIRAAAGNTPVMFAVGNSDSYTGYGPNSEFLDNTVDYFYTDFLNSSVDYQTFKTTFTNAGYYSAEPKGMNLVVVGLNTILFAPGVPANPTGISQELAWFDATLASAQARGKKVWLLIHVPPGASIGVTASQADPDGHITTSSAAMMWVPEHQEAFLRTLARYPGVVTMTLAAHTHMDEFRLMSASNVLDITPAISAYFGNDPAFKIFSISQDGLAPTDYHSLNYDLATQPAEFESYYTFSSAYATQGGDLNFSLAQLYPAIITDPTKQALYREQYESGHDAASQINDTNWPIFACGIGKMDLQDFVTCVNNY